MTVKDLVLLLQGVSVIVTADNVGTSQCVDLAQIWNRVCGGSRFTGDAHTIYTQAGTTYTQIPNSPTNIPQAGDIVIWSPAYNGGPGHVAVATGNGDVNNFEVLEQNDPLGSDVELKTYNYTDVMGWLHPNNPPEDQQALIDQLRKERDTNWNLYQTELTKNNDLQTQLSDCQSKAVIPTTNDTPADTSNIVVTGTSPTTSATSTGTNNNPTTPVQSIPNPTPIKPKMSFIDNIVFIFMNTISVLIYGKKL